MLLGKNLTKTYHVPDADRRFGTKPVRALRGVSIAVETGRTMGVVGESGSGKSTLARALALLEKPDAGEVSWGGKAARAFSKEERKEFRRNVQVVFQDPYASLNPRLRIQQALEEPFRIHPQKLNGPIGAAVDRLLDTVGLPVAYKKRLPDELSGGERQRVAIARAVALEPKIVICDEPVSSLDVLVQAQILNLFMRLQKEKGLGLLFISHDLRVIGHMSDTVAVIHDGLIVEEGPAEQVLSRPSQPYTRTLLDATFLR